MERFGLYKISGGTNTEVWDTKPGAYGHSCQNCGQKGVTLERHMVRMGFAFGKDFPVKYEHMMLCHECRDFLIQKEEKVRKIAMAILAIVLFMIGLNFFLIFGSILF